MDKGTIPPPVVGAAPPTQPQQRRSTEQIKSDLQALTAGIKAAQEMKQEPEQETVEEPKKDETDEQQDEFFKNLDTYIDLFSSPERKKRIEANLEPMKVSDLVLHGELRQKVRLSAGIDVVFRTISGEETQEILRILSSDNGSELYMRERLALMNLAVGLHSIGGEVLESVYDQSGNFDEARFLRRFKKVLKYPMQLLADMRVNYYWFDQRVQKVMIAEELGNG